LQIKTESIKDITGGIPYVGILKLIAEPNEDEDSTKGWIKAL
jgi:hypothetical protein